MKRKIFYPFKMSILFINMLVFLGCISCSNDNNVTDDDIYDLTWADTLKSNIAIVNIENIKYEISDTISVDTGGGGCFLKIKDKNRKLLFSWFPVSIGSEIDTFKLYNLFYTDGSHDIQERYPKGFIAVNKYKLIKNVNIHNQDSILVEGVFHLKLDTQNGTARDIKGAFRYNGLSDFLIGGL